MFETFLKFLSSLIEKAATIWAAFSAGRAQKESEDIKDELAIAKERLDIANAPDPSVDDVAEWLSDDGKGNS